MLEHLRRRVVSTLAQAPSVALATHGPAGLLTTVFPCAATELTLYVRVPRTSDHLVNLEANSEVTLATCQWQARGRAHLASWEARPPTLVPASEPESRWYEIVEVKLARIDLGYSLGWGVAETIDLE
jgi:hypothetical protein